MTSHDRAKELASVARHVGNLFTMLSSVMQDWATDLETAVSSPRNPAASSPLSNHSCDPQTMPSRSIPHPSALSAAPDLTGTVLTMRKSRPPQPPSLQPQLPQHQPQPPPPPPPPPHAVRPPGLMPAPAPVGPGAMNIAAQHASSATAQTAVPPPAPIPPPPPPPPPLRRPHIPPTTPSVTAAHATPTAQLHHASLHSHSHHHQHPHQHSHPHPHPHAHQIPLPQHALSHPHGPLTPAVGVDAIYAVKKRRSDEEHRSDDTAMRPKRTRVDWTEAENVLLFSTLDKYSHLPENDLLQEIVRALGGSRTLFQTRGRFRNLLANGRIRATDTLPKRWVVVPGRTGRRVRVNWSEEEDQALFDTVRRCKCYGEDELLQEIVKSLKGTRTWFQAKGHFRNLLTSGRIRASDTIPPHWVVVEEEDDDDEDDDEDGEEEGEEEEEEEEEEDIDEDVDEDDGHHGAGGSDIGSGGRGDVTDVAAATGAAVAAVLQQQQSQQQQHQQEQEQRRQQQQQNEIEQMKKAHGHGGDGTGDAEHAAHGGETDHGGHVDTEATAF